MQPLESPTDGSSATAFSIGDREFGALKTIVEARLGISMPDSKRAMMETRLLRRLRQLSMTTAAEYCRYLHSDRGQAEELHKFLDLVTTNKTSFFRELPQLDFLQDKVLPTMLAAAAREGRPLRVWSAACSTGQEVWTLVMMLDRLAQMHAPNADYCVWGSDVSGRVLEVAMAAKYDREEMAELDPQFTSRFFMRAKDPSVRVMRVRPEYRKKAGFFHQNLMDAAYKVPQRVDAIFLRNALIYFPREKQMNIVSHAARHLNAGGVFIVGLTESLHGFPLPFRHRGQSVYQQEELG